MTPICIYGTVYNNVNTVEKSIASVWRPEYDLVVVDNFSTDGTWEKLLALRKEYNLKIYRYHCSRGLGRNIALHRCPRNSVTTWFDLDTIYTPAFHKAIEYCVETEQIIHIGPLIAKREYIIKKGGWRDLNYAEDIELISRIGFNVHIPIIAGFNEQASFMPGLRERRYGKLKRFIKSSLDATRGCAPSIWRLYITRSKRLSVFYLPGLLIGFYRNRKPDNDTWVEKASFIKAIPPRKASIDEVYFHLGISLLLMKIIGNEETIDNKIRTLVSGTVYKFYINTRSTRILYYKNPRFLNASFIPYLTGFKLMM